MLGKSVENTVKWLWKKVCNKVYKVKMKLKKQYSFLLEEKKNLTNFGEKGRNK